MRFGPLFFIILRRLYSGVGAAQVFIDNALVRPVLVDEVEATVGGLGQDDRLLQLRQWA